MVADSSIYLPAVRGDITIIDVIAHHRDRQFWHSRTPHDRLAAAEIMRRLEYGEAACNARFEPVLEILNSFPPDEQ
jgi:hypothetical protein